MSFIEPHLFEFFGELKENNNRDWFAENKWRYEHHVKEPLLAFINAFAPKLAEISPHYEATKKSLFRIYRDVRFSKDKSPYKTTAGVHFRHSAGKDAHAPGFYVHLESGKCFAGIGTWGPDNKTLFKIRTAIVEYEDRWSALMQDALFLATYDLSAHDQDRLKRPPKGFDGSHPLIETLKRKHFIASAALSDEEVCSSEFVGKLAETFEGGAPFMKFLTEAVGFAWQ